MIFSQKSIDVFYNDIIFLIFKLLINILTILKSNFYGIIIIGFTMKKFLIICFMLLLSANYSFAFDYVSIKPELLTRKQTTSYNVVNETTQIVFNRIKPKINTKKYPKYFHDFKLISDDGTQNKAYKYVKYSNNVELIYAVDTNELKYVAYRRPELQKCRIMYDYPSGKLHAVQVFVSPEESFVYSSEGKYVDYEPYVKEVHQKVKNSWKVPKRKTIEELAKGQKDLLVQTAVVLNKEGAVKKIITLKSSKIKALDDNANEAIKNASPFEPFPDNFFNEELIIILNFNFSL